MLGLQKKETKPGTCRNEYVILYITPTFQTCCVKFVTWVYTYVISLLLIGWWENWMAWD